MLWFALLIPCVLTIMAYAIWSKRFTIWELFVPIVACLVLITGSYFTLKSVNMRDVEYNGYVIVEARYYEYWSTWVEQTCTRQVACGTNSKGETQYCTETYDCSYCNTHSPYWEVVDNHGHTYSISQAKYQELTNKWKARPEFVELNRRINRDGSCGVDGDMYSIRWDFDIKTSESAVIKRPFQNIVKVSHSAFKYPEMTQDEARQFGLYDYPEIYDYYKQPAILGLDSFKCSFDKLQVQNYFEYLNGYLGPIKKVKVFTLLFKGNNLDAAFKQEQYWEGGNQNEIVVCIGLNDTMGINWVKPFSWCDNKRLLVDIREDIASMNKFDPEKTFFIYKEAIDKSFHYKRFSDFNYLTFEPTAGQIWWVYFLTLIISVLSIWWCVKNKI